MTEPDSLPTKRREKKAEPTNAVPASELLPQLGGAPGVAQQFHYWIGALPGAPWGQIDVHGITFPKVTELVRSEPDRGTTQRIPQLGTIHQLTTEQLDRIRKAATRLVVRFLEQPREDEPGVGSDVVAMTSYRPRRGEKVRIPTAEQAGNRRVRPYSRHQLDEPAVGYIYAVLCEDQDNPSCGGVVPEPLSRTGLVLPEGVTL